MALKKAKVLENKKLTDNVYCVTYLSEEIFNFTAGQYISIKVNDGGKPCFRAYSINSRPPDDGQTFETCIKVVNEGRGSNYIKSLKKEDEIEFMGPIGEFTFKTPEEKTALFIATGTGLSPLKSMIEDQLSKGSQQKMHLIFGVRHIKDIFYKEYFEELDHKHTNFTFDLTLSQPEDEWHGNEGRVTNLLEKMDIDKKKTEAYICGLKNMIDSVDTLLKAKGLKEEAIHFEKYD